MLIKFIQTATKPRFKNRKRGVNDYDGDHGIRAYRTSPSDMYLQIWGERSFATAALDLPQVIALHDKLTEIREELELIANNPMTHDEIAELINQAPRR